MLVPFQCQVNTVRLHIIASKYKKIITYICKPRTYIVCMYVHMYSMYVCTYVRMYVLYVCTYGMYEYMCICMTVCTVCMYVCMNACMSVCV